MKEIKKYDTVTDDVKGFYSVVESKGAYDVIYIYEEKTRKIVGVIQNTGKKLDYHECITKTRKAAEIFQGVAALNDKFKKRVA